MRGGRFREDHRAHNAGWLSFQDESTCPQVSCLHHSKINLVKSKRSASGPKKQIQPSAGLEKQLGEVVREIREERDISQDRLAREMDTDRTTISLIERGLRSPYVRTLIQVAAALDVKPSEFFRRLEIRMGDSWRNVRTDGRKRRIGD